MNPIFNLAEDLIKKAEDNMPKKKEVNDLKEFYQEKEAEDRLLVKQLEHIKEWVSELTIDVPTERICDVLDKAINRIKGDL